MSLRSRTNIIANSKASFGKTFPFVCAIILVSGSTRPFRHGTSPTLPSLLSQTVKTMTVRNLDTEALPGNSFSSDPRPADPAKGLATLEALFQSLQGKRASAKVIHTALEAVAEGTDADVVFWYPGGEDETLDVVCAQAGGWIGKMRPAIKAAVSETAGQMRLLRRQARRRHRSASPWLHLS